MRFGEIIRAFIFLVIAVSSVQRLAGQDSKTLKLGRVARYRQENIDDFGFLFASGGSIPGSSCFSSLQQRRFSEF